MSQDMLYLGYLMDLKSVLGHFLFSCSINYSERDTEVSSFIGKFTYFPFQLYQVFVFPSSQIFQLFDLVHTYFELLCHSWWMGTLIMWCPPLSFLCYKAYFIWYWYTAFFWLTFAWHFLNPLNFKLVIYLQVIFEVNIFINRQLIVWSYFLIYPVDLIGAARLFTFNVIIGMQGLSLEF